MPRTAPLRLSLAAALLLAVPALAQGPAESPAARPVPRPGRNSGGRPIHNEAERAARWKPIPIPYNTAGLSPREQQMIAKLVDACHLLDQLYLHQSDLGGYQLYHATRNPILLRLFQINGSRWDLVDSNQPFIGEEPLVPGREYYPFGLTSSAVNAYVAAHPDQKAALYDPHTLVRSAPLDLNPSLSQPVVHGTPDKLYTYPYHVAYARWLQPMAADLRAAAALSPDPAFAHYLTLRAAALLSDDYYSSDIAWLDLKDPKIDLIFAPYETYLDGLLGVKTSYGASILIRNQPESAKLALYQQHEAEMQQALPIDPADKPSKAGHATPMEVADAPLRAGDLRYGYSVVADNLPNDPRVHAEKGSKKIFFKNFMDARVNEVILPVAQKLLTSDQASQVSGEGYLTAVILHEISHGHGPAYSRVNGQQVPITQALGPVGSGLEEAKADVTGIFLAHWLADQHLIPASDLPGIYASFVAGIFRTLRFGTGEAHGRAEMMEFNVLLEHHALTQDPATGLYTIDYAVMPDAIRDLSHQLLTFEATGDRAGAEAWMTRYDVIPPALTRALESTSDIPVDVTPDFALDKGFRP